MEKVLYLLLGWALGLLGPAVVEAIRRKREVIPVRKALLDELHELKYRLAISAYQTERRFGTISKPYLQWLRNIVIAYKGRKPKDSILTFIDGELALSDEQFAILTKRELANADGGLALKKYLAPLLDSRIPSLWFFDSSFRQRLLDVRAELDLLNEEIDQAQYYFGLTFTKLEEDNRARVDCNLTEAYRQIAKRAKVAVEKIGELEGCQ